MCAVFLVSTIGGTAAAAVPDTIQGKLAIVEQTAYGTEQTGALLDRINKLERDFTGTHAQGSIADRVGLLYNYMFDNSTSPSLVTQMNAIEWGITHQVSMKSIQERVTNMETTVQGKPSEGTYKARINKLSSYAFGGKAVPLVQTTVPENTLVKISLVTPINAKDLKAGDKIEYQVAEDVIENGMLVFAKGALGEGNVNKVVQARNFGRDAEVAIDFKTARAIDGTTVDMFLGEEAKKQMKSMAMAAGASLAGIVLLGPVGIVAGVFVNGKNVNLPAGTEMYIQTKAANTLYGIQTTAE
jgi:hypothetical protein